MSLVSAGIGLRSSIRTGLGTSGTASRDSITSRRSTAAIAAAVSSGLGLVVQNVGAKEPARVEVRVLDEVHHLVHKDVRPKGAGMAV